MLKELLFEGSNSCFDQAVCLDLKITEQDIEKLCSTLKETAIKNGNREGTTLFAQSKRPFLADSKFDFENTIKKIVNKIINRFI